MLTKSMSDETLKQLGMSKKQFQEKVNQMVDSVTSIVDLDGDGFIAKSVKFKFTLLFTSYSIICFFEYIS